MRLIVVFIPTSCVFGYPETQLAGIKSNATGVVEWRPEVTSQATTSKGYEYKGKEYNGLSIKTYKPLSLGAGAGVEIQVDYKDTEASSDLDFMQTVSTNLPPNGVKSPYNDPKPADDNKPFCWTDVEKPEYSNKDGQSLTFADMPRRASSKDGTTWSGELSLTVKSDGKHSIKETLSYGFEIKNGKSALSPIVVKPTSEFQRKTLEDYNKTLKK